LPKLSDDRIEKLLLAILLQFMKGAPLKERVIQLNLAGFSNIEIADYLQTSPQVVAQYVYETRRRRSSPRRKKTFRK